MAAEESCWVLLCFAILWGQFCCSNTKDLKCTCQSGCRNNGLTFPGSHGRIVNVAYNKEASMSSYHNRDGGSGPACAAVNGRTGTRWRANNTNKVNCVHTAHDNINAWWEVDLGHYYTVNDITIYRRKDKPRRMAGGSVTVDGQLCYSFPNSANIAALDDLPKQIDITCTRPLNGRVVRFQKHGQDTGSDFYHINICEVQVWACRPGLYGRRCEKTCSDHCKNKNTCDNYYGTCLTGCLDGDYGHDCALQCGKCRENDTCNAVTGECPRGCDHGWTTPFCNQSDTNDTNLVLVGTITGVLVIVTAVVLLLIFILRYCRRPKQRTLAENNMPPSVSQELEWNNPAEPEGEENSADVITEENYELLETNKEDDRAPYSTPVFANQNSDYENQPPVYTNVGAENTDYEVI